MKYLLVLTTMLAGCSQSARYPVVFTDTHAIANCRYQIKPCGVRLYDCENFENQETLCATNITILVK